MLTPEEKIKALSSFTEQLKINPAFIEALWGLIKTLLKKQNTKKSTFYEVSIGTLEELVEVLCLIDHTELVATFAVKILELTSSEQVILIKAFTVGEQYNQKYLTAFNAAIKITEMTKGHTKKRSASESAVPKLTKLMSFHNPIGEASSSNSLPSPRKRAASKNDGPGLEDFFNDLFACDKHKATGLVLALAQDTENFAAGVFVLDAVSSNKNKQIAEVLLANLPEARLLEIVALLFKLEQTQTWCRGSRLLANLIQAYIESNANKIFKEFIVQTVFSLKTYTDQLSISEDGSTNSQLTDLTLAFAEVVKNLFNPQNFPAFMQKILRLADLDLQARHKLNPEQKMAMLLGIIPLRFVNPIIMHAPAILANTHDHEWFFSVFSAVLQVWANGSEVKNDVYATVKTRLLAGLQPLARSAQYELITTVIAQVAMQQPAAVPQPKLTLAECLPLVETHFEKMSGLDLKTDGSVTPRRTHAKLSSGMWPAFSLSKFLKANSSNSEDTNTVASTTTPAPSVTR